MGVHPQRMFTLCWSPKGGSGTTVAAATLALNATTSILIDLAGDAPAALGVPAGSEGILDWMRSDTDPLRLDDLCIEIDSDHHLICAGRPGSVPARRWAVLADHLASIDASDVVVDAGTINRPPNVLSERADRRLMVLRPCYVALRRAHESAVVPDGVILLDEPGRALTATDVERCIGAPVLAEVMVDPSVARAVDAGLLAVRAPRSLIPIAKLAAS